MFCKVNDYVRVTLGGHVYSRKNAILWSARTGSPEGWFSTKAQGGGELRTIGIESFGVFSESGHGVHCSSWFREDIWTLFQARGEEIQQGVVCFPPSRRGLS